MKYPHLFSKLPASQQEVCADMCHVLSQETEVQNMTRRKETSPEKQQKLKGTEIRTKKVRVIVS